VLFPTNDHWATAIAKHKVHLERYYIPCVADWSVVELLVRKDKFYPWAMKRGYPVPKLYPIDELMKAESDVYPVIAKPKYRRLSGQGREGDKCNIVKRLDENRMVVLESNSALHRFLSANEDLLPYLIFQEYVSGMADRMYTVGIYADRNHDVLGIFTGRKVRGFPPDIGDCVVGQAEKLPSELVTLVKKMVKDLHYLGAGDLGLYRMASTIYGIAMLVAAIGIPAAMIKYVAEFKDDRTKFNQIVSSGIITSLFLGRKHHRELI